MKKPCLAFLLLLAGVALSAQGLEAYVHFGDGFQTPTSLGLGYSFRAGGFGFEPRLGLGSFIIPDFDKDKEGGGGKDDGPKSFYLTLSPSLAVTADLFKLGTSQFYLFNAFLARIDLFSSPGGESPSWEPWTDDVAILANESGLGLRLGPIWKLTSRLELGVEWLRYAWSSGAFMVDPHWTFGFFLQF